ncbi:TonB-dependent receptor [Pedobacter sp. JY14-1]|uniref:TonB-dependent receptor n=1 Tax=Pedobacter sp. JY14-1 TaxID=3034151 RepID=UPI0023E0A315|nr:TonB-dependent receptor [Pedobacter sp. JY14-1]
MFKSIFLTLLCLLSASASICYAQQANTPANPGSAKGIVRDTAQNYVLKSATVSIYKAADSTLLSYQVTNNYGEFSFRNLPVSLPLRLEISHVGYMTGRKNFTIPASKNFIDLETIIVNRQDITLKDVVISVPPVSINGDTLEFNAAAFKLDTNATVEDMLRKIPNITLWGDGLITVNGAEVKSLKVNGKTFFGGDAKVAIQNISKNALQKVQVYNTVKDQSNPLDSTLEMNLKLKKGKDIGFFGKISAGYGTDNRYEMDASINMYTPKMQLAVIGALNNINKTPNSINSLMANSTFKGVGTNVEYQPDFRATGLNRPGAAGASLTYNFIENPTYQRKSTLKSNYFLQDRSSDFLSETKTTTSVSSSDKIIENSNSSNSSSNTRHRFDNSYEYGSRGHDLNFTQSVNLDREENTEQNLRSAENLQGELTSTNNSSNYNKYNNRNFNLKGDYRYSPYIITSKTRFRGLSAIYDFSLYENEGQRINRTEFRSLTDATANRVFNRKYDTNSDGSRQEINITVPDLKTILLGNKQMAGISFDVTNKLVLKTDKNNNRVQDLDTLTNIYQENSYLSNRIQTNEIEETPGLRIQRSFRKSLSNRFYTNLTFRFHPKIIMMDQDNKSDRAFQNIRRNYHKFVPDAGIDYSDNQYGEYYRSVSLNYFTTLRIPNIQQLAPLTDSTNLYYLQRGNLNLRAGVQQELSLNLNHYDQSNKNSLNFYFNVRAGLVKDNIVDSIFIDAQNRRTVYQINADGHRYINFYGEVRKAFKLKTSELQFSLNSSMNANRNPGYTNNQFTFSSNLNTYNNASVNYTYKSIFAFVLDESFNTYSSKQQEFNTGYSGKNLGTNFSTTYNVTKKLTLYSNVSFNQSSSSSADNINFTIWNASAIYRFLKGNNAEIKFSALDLLRQNSSVINYGNSNSFTIGTQNVLKQYFMTTISYYPRQFGKKSKPASK